MLHCYKLAKCNLPACACGKWQDTIFIEHKTLYEADNVSKYKAGNVFLAQNRMADTELMHSTEVCHSLAEVIVGEENDFWMHSFCVMQEE